MTEYRTTSCHQFGQKEIVMGLDVQSGIEPAWLVNFFEKNIAEGKHFKPNETVQIGWMIVLLKEMASGDLDIWEPQFDSIPIKWTRGVNNTLRHLVLQKSVAELFKEEPIFPSLRHSGLASKPFLSTQNQSDFRMTREVFHGNDSGWRFNSFPYENQDTEPRSLFELSFHRMNIVPFLALPIGATVIKSGNDITVELRGVSISSKQNHFLQELVCSNILV